MLQMVMICICVMKFIFKIGLLFSGTILFFSLNVFAADKSGQSTSVEREIAELKLELDTIKSLLAQKVEAKTAITKQEQEDQNVAPSNKKSDKNWEINSYGSLRYKSEEVFSNTQDTDPERRASTDLERVVLEFVYDYDEKWQVEAEIEYEHGGVGSTLEYDGFEEFGEFETEIEAGGEIIVEKLQVKYQHSENLSIKMGHIFVPVGLGTDLHKPAQYLTTGRHWSEATLIPQVWHETGVNFIGHWQGFTGQALVTTGLNSEFFRTYNWVATGHQKRFEQVNADDLAYTIRLDYGDVKKGKGIGVSFYTGDTSGNRNNSNKISGDGNLTLWGIHGVWESKSWLFRGQYLSGTLEDSQEITLANKTTPGLKPGNFAQLGSEAESAFFEAAYNSQSLFSLSKPLYFFAAYEYANPTKKVAQGAPIDRFNIQEVSIGMNYLPIPELVFKVQIAQQMYAQDNLDDTHTFSLSLGYYFSI